MWVVTGLRCFERDCTSKLWWRIYTRKQNSFNHLKEIHPIDDKPLTLGWSDWPYKHWRSCENWYIGARLFFPVKLGHFNLNNLQNQNWIRTGGSGLIPKIKGKKLAIENWVSPGRLLVLELEPLVSEWDRFLI